MEAQATTLVHDAVASGLSQAGLAGLITLGLCMVLAVACCFID